VKGKLVREKAEELICLTLKGETSLAMYQEVAIKGCDLFSANLDNRRRIKVTRLDYNSKTSLTVTRGGFTEAPDSHYYPDWARHQDPSMYCTNKVRMTSKTNFSFSIKRKTTVTQISDMEKEDVRFASPDVRFVTAQLLLNTNKYLYVGDPIGQLAQHFQTTKNRFREAIVVTKKGDGFIASLNGLVFDRVILDEPFRQITSMAISRRPIVDLLDSTPTGWNYATKNGAIMALFLHCIMNVHLRHGMHWSLNYLMHSKELLLLLPTTRVQDTAAACAVIYRQKDDNVRIRQISNRCKILPPAIIAMDHNQVFHPKNISNRYKSNV
jgi:hypothetical protein